MWHQFAHVYRTGVIYKGEGHYWKLGVIAYSNINTNCRSPVVKEKLLHGLLLLNIPCTVDVHTPTVLSS